CLACRSDGSRDRVRKAFATSVAPTKAEKQNPRSSRLKPRLRGSWGFPRIIRGDLPPGPSMPPSTLQPVVSELIELLSLERLEDNLFRGQSRDIGTKYVFGG